MAKTALRSIDRAAHYAAQLPATGDDPVWLKAMRDEAMARFQTQGFPTLRDEAWKYTNLDRLTRNVFTPREDATRIDEEIIAPYKIDGQHLLVFVDGHLLSGLCDLGSLPEGICLASFGRVVEYSPELIEPHLRHAESALTALNLALMKDGAVIVLPKNMVIEKPIHLIHVTTGAKEGTAAHPRHLIVLNEGAAATVVATFIGIGRNAAWTNAVTEAIVGRNARLRHYAWIEEAANGFHTGRLALTIERDASVETLGGTGQGGTVRNEIVATLAGEGAEARIDGATLGRGRAHVDSWTEIVHAAPRTNSRQVFKSVLDDRARSAFQGRIVVNQGAQKIDAHQLNKNLLLSPQARADSKPELEILADDVKCSHGATVGDLDKNQMFYLRARGIPEVEARALLVEAFVSELLDHVSNVIARDWLRARMGVWLAPERKKKAA
jgi:Fe-S cluster assembly protein SufD